VKRGFTYTHKPVLGAQFAANREIIAYANERGFTINLSGNNPAHADELASLAIAPVVTVLPIEYARTGKARGYTESLETYRARLKGLPQATPAGNRIVVCPATYSDSGVNCASCALCAVRERKVIVGFPAHGAKSAQADSVARLAQ
jgi:hypothetical protein